MIQGTLHLPLDQSVSGDHENDHLPDAALIENLSQNQTQGGDQQRADK